MAETLLFAAEGLQAAGATSAATGVASAGGAIGGLMSSGVGSLLSGGLTAASAFGSIMGGNQQAAVYKAQAAQSELAAKQEELKGREQADRIRRSLQATLASQNAAFAARGISLSSGTPVTVGNMSRTEAARDIESAQFGAAMSAAQERAQAGQYKISAKSSKISGYTDAATRFYAGRNSFGSLL